MSDEEELAVEEEELAVEEEENFQQVNSFHPLVSYFC